MSLVLSVWLEPTGGDPHHFFEKFEILEKARCHMNRKTAYDLCIMPKFSNIPRGQRLTDNRIKALDIGYELLPWEWDLLLTLLFNLEAAIAFDWHEKGLIKPEMEPPHIIRIRQGHIRWQELPMRVPGALHVTFDNLVTEMRRSGTLEPSKGLYRNPAFLVKQKKPEEYRLIS